MSASEGVRPPPELLRAAAEYRWSHPDGTWQQVADHVKRSVRQVDRWRQTEEWETIFRDVGAAHVEKLAPAAVGALVRAWTKGNSAGAIEVLRSFGFLQPEEVKVRVSQEQAAQVIAIVNEAVAAFAVQHGLSAEQDVELRASVAAALPDRVG